jgi:hypothetical protein
VSRRADILVLGVAAAACLLAPPLALAGVGGPLRVAATVVLMGMAPGAAILGGRAAREPGLTLVITLTVCVVAAQGMLAIGVWSAARASAVLAAIALPVLVIRLCREVGNGRLRPSEAGQRRSVL